MSLKTQGHSNHGHAMIIVNSICGFHFPTFDVDIDFKYFQSKLKVERHFKKRMLFEIFNVFADIFQFHILHTFQSKYGN